MTLLPRCTARRRTSRTLAAITTGAIALGVALAGAPTSQAAERLSVDSIGTDLGGRFVHMNDGPNGCELWSTDGTQKGSRQIADIQPGRGDSKPQDLTRVGRFVYFTARTSKTGYELWRSDGTAKGTTMVREITPGKAGSTLTRLTAVGNKLWFQVDRPGKPSQLWRSDGSRKGTRPMVKLGPLGDDYTPDATAAYRGRFYFSYARPGKSAVLWRTSASGRSIEPVTRSGGTTLVEPEAFAVMKSKLYVADWSGLSVTDGTTKGTEQIKSLTAAGNSGGMVAFKGALYFRGQTNDGSGTELWRSDGTRDGTALFKNISDDEWISGDPHWFAAGTKNFYFVADTPATGEEVWRSDGTLAGTKMITDLQPGDFGSDPRYLHTIGNRVFFVAAQGPLGRQIWRSDGTRASTRMAFYPSLGTTSTSHLGNCLGF